MTIIENLKKRVTDSEQLVKETRIIYLEMKDLVKQKEKELKIAKSNFNRSHKNWVRAKKLVIKTKSKLSRYPSEKRRWAKEHMDKVMELIEK